MASDPLRRPPRFLQGSLALLLFGTGLSVTLSDVGFVLLLGTALWVWIRKRNFPSLTPLGLLSLALFLVYGIAGFFSPFGPQTALTGFREARSLLLIPLLASFSWKGEAWRIPSIALLLGAGIGGLVGLTEAVHFYGYLHTVGIHRLNYSLATLARTRGPYTTYMTFGEVQAMAAVWATALFPYWRLLTGSVALVGTLGAWLSLTRMTWFAWGVGTGLVAFFRRPLLVLGLLMALGTVFLVVPEGVRYRARDFLRPGATFQRSRLPIWRVAVRAIRARPLTGWGEGHAPALFQQFRDPDRGPLPYRHFHSNLLHISVVAGVLGGSLYLAWALLAFVEGVRGIRGHPPGPDRHFLLGALAAVLIFHVAGITEYTFGDAEVAYLYAALLGLMEGVRRP